MGLIFQCADDIVIVQIEIFVCTVYRLQPESTVMIVTVLTGG